MPHALTLAVAGLVASASAEPLRLETAEGHPMQYYVSPPRGWSAARSWPIVVVVEAAEKEFEANARRFVDARGDLPFIIVAPIVVTNGRQGQRDPRVYPYSPATWDAIERDGVCGFDLEGLGRVLDKVRRTYRGEERVFATGFEAGAHLVWALVLQRPETLRAAAPVAGNYMGRCVDESAISTHPARADLPVQAFVGADDEPMGPRGPLHAQFERARKLAQEHGYRAVSETLVRGKGHVPMPGEVLAFFAGLAR